jgi:sugar (pentulose or hexulose) kinase
MPEQHAIALGIDESTTKTGVGVRSAASSPSSAVQAYADVGNRGGVRWQGQPAFDLAELPGMIVEVLDVLAARGWKFDQPAALSFSIRQHDMVLLGDGDELLLPALTWQCNAATAEVAALRSAGAEEIVGRIEERFILPKLLSVLAQDPSLRRRVRHVMTTGDYLAYQLTGQFRLSTSDALSNGLLEQRDKSLAVDVIRNAGLDPAWFPQIIASGHPIGRVQSTPLAQSSAANTAWNRLRARLAGWQVVAGLGDNHATGVGCGGLIDDRTIVVSAGTSGTINRRVRPNTELKGAAACFEFYDDRLLLLMLADCAAWYQRFVEQHGEGCKHAELNELAISADLSKVRRVRHTPGGDAAARETLPNEWSSMSLGERAASTQLSIVAELLRLVRGMLAEAPGAPPVARYVLTGGLSQSSFFQQAFEAGVDTLAQGGKPTDVDALVSAQADELSYQTAAYGALINALLPSRQGDLAAICHELCPLKPAAAAADARRGQLQKLLVDWTRG